MIDENVSHVNNFSTPCWKLYEKVHFWAPIAEKVREHQFDLQNKKAAFSDIKVHFSEPHWSQY